jgi:hypothetical protein
MRSFTLSLVALCLGAVASATPFVPSGNSVDAVGAADAAVNTRDTPRGVAAIVMEVTDKLDPLFDQIGQLLLQRLLDVVY